MGERHEAAGGANERNHVAGAGAASRHVRRTLVAQQPQERILATAGKAGGDERLGDLRAPDAAAAVARGLREKVRTVDGGAEVAQANRHLLDAADAIGALRGEEPEQLRRLGVEEVGEQVHVAGVLDRGDFNPVDEAHAEGIGGRARLRQSRHRIVIRDAQHGNAGRRRALNERGRRQRAIRRGRMQVQIDQDGRAADARRRVALPRRVRWRSTSARYSRMSSSRCVRSSSANSRKIRLPSESSNFSP